MEKILKEILENIKLGVYETLSIEFKGSFNFLEKNHNYLKEKVVKGVLAMANSYGGYIVIGISESGDSPEVEGISKDRMDIFKKHRDGLEEYIRSFASCPIEFRIEFLDINEMSFVMIKIEEFSSSPIICLKAGQNNPKVLEQSAIYVRGLLSKPESVKVFRLADMESLLDKAVNRRIFKLNDNGWVHNTQIEKILENVTIKLNDVNKKNDIPKKDNYKEERLNFE